jgi:FixJ family two-component response regulator
MASEKTILIVDDDRDLVSGLRSVLESKGYKSSPPSTAAPA